ncbi:DUF3180 domain-containing protein [Corynebacterium caspium]|uniref:DUF3180 domain-containing protein n=1 Tax=Corynebacterium caspium TaxID=234828 RepID=UPI000378EED7|nr:DUF3180 domain-containing protein [Corynebacterium caspium]WKD58696.1 hypothetical protein CCASP_01350 [Corynebacterium caspium DSM 44850]
MQRTPIAGLLATGIFLALASGIATWRFFGMLSSIPVTVSATLWLLFLICIMATLKVRKNLAEGTIGLDRSQLDPLLVARFMILGKASAWTGAIIGGIYSGMAAYLLAISGDNIAASQDAPGAALSALGGIALTAAGVWLERTCEVAPPADPEAIG